MSAKAAYNPRHAHPAFAFVRLRTGLFLLVAGTLVPVLLLALVLGTLLIEHERATFQRLALDRNRAVLSAVDAALQGHVSTLQALSVSSNLARGEYGAFERRLERILQSQPDWLDVTLSSPDGHRLVDAVLGKAMAGSEVQDLPSLKRAVETRQAAIGPVHWREPSNAWGIAVRYPVVDPATQQVAYVLSAIVKPAQFQRLIEAQDLPKRWVSGLVDQSFHFVARVPARSPKDMASSDFQAALRGADQGWFRGKTFEGIDTFTAFLRLPTTGWSIGMAVPADEVTASSRRTTWILVGGTLVALLLAAGFAYWAGQRIATPIADLASAARRLGRGESTSPGARLPAIAELGDVERAVGEAGAALAERQSLREREQAALREADRAKDEFIAVLGHELRNPLSAIATSVRLLRAAPQGSPAEAMARDIIERQSKQMTRLVEDLLDMSRLATGKLTLHRERVDLAELAGALVQTWEQSQRIVPGRVRLHLAPVQVDADRARLEQITANLLDNANKFTPAGRCIDVHVRAEGERAVLEVADEGEGLEPELLQTMFRPFVQGPQEHHRPSGGLGLGLAVVSRLVLLHGGTIEATSAGAGHGSTFTVRLPRAV